MNSAIKSLVNPKLYNIFLDLSKDDVIFQSVINKTKNTNNIGDFLNALLAALILTKDRETTSLETIKQLIDSNPQLKELIDQKKIIHDQPMLSEKPQ